MNCPVCDYADTRVIDTRANPDGVWRRRHCDRCKHRWYTQEVVSSELDRLKGIERAAATLRELLPEA